MRRLRGMLFVACWTREVMMMAVYLLLPSCQQVYLPMKMQTHRQPLASKTPSRALPPILPSWPTRYPLRSIITSYPLVSRVGMAGRTPKPITFAAKWRVMASVLLRQFVPWDPTRSLWGGTRPTFLIRCGCQYRTISMIGFKFRYRNLVLDSRERIQICRNGEFRGKAARRSRDTLRVALFFLRKIRTMTEPPIPWKTSTRSKWRTRTPPNCTCPAGSVERRDGGARRTARHLHSADSMEGVTSVRTRPFVPSDREPSPSADIRRRERVGRGCRFLTRLTATTGCKFRRRMLVSYT
mmetsp:Transcript_4984/g.8594  ORF Transcript_4984/g.8594 Transcript_4984/m.8594 type:complete len:296 (+) Transcript_4984:1877-2764(+)